MSVNSWTLLFFVPRNPCVEWWGRRKGRWRPLSDLSILVALFLSSSILKKVFFFGWIFSWDDMVSLVKITVVVQTSFSTPSFFLPRGWTVWFDRVRIFKNSNVSCRTRILFDDGFFLLPEKLDRCVRDKVLPDRNRKRDSDPYHSCLKKKIRVR